MNRIFLYLILSVIIIIFLAGCSNNQSATDNLTNTDTPEVETTTMNNLPDNKFSEDKLVFEPDSLVLDESIDYYTEYYDDGSCSDVYESNKYIESVNYDEKGILRDYSKTTFDDMGRTSCKYVYNSDKTLKYACLREYDSLGRYYRYYFYNYECRLICYEVVSYDGYGNEQSVKLYDTFGNSIEDFPDEFD